MIESQKLEELLYLSLSATERERQESKELSTGYDRVTGLWELIIKYQGDVNQLVESGVMVEPLINGYAIVTIPENRIANYIQKPEIEYVEMPKKLFEESYDGRREICVFEQMGTPSELTGEGVIVGIIDSGIDIFHEEFRWEDGSTRLIGFWDQSMPADGTTSAPEGFSYGVYFDEERINQILNGAYENISLGDFSGHGTAVASIAAGSNIGVARKSSILAVKLGSALGGSYPRTTQLMRAVHFLTTKAQRLGKPIAINISFGNCYGDHLGSSLLERFLNAEAAVGRNVICVGSGNEAEAFGHYHGRIHARERQKIELSVGNYETSLNLQLWKNYQDELGVRIIAPGGEQFTIKNNQREIKRIRLGNTEILCFLGGPTPYSIMQELYLEFYGLKDYVDYGVWQIVVEAGQVKNGNYDFYLPSYAIRNQGTGFYLASPYGTFTIPSTAESVISVGAIMPGYGSYAEFSGRGFSEYGEKGLYPNLNKPDMVAPGVEVLGASAGGGYSSFTGTSFSTPYVTGSAALLMEWGILRGNDRYLYGQKCKAYLIKGARQVFGERQMPSAKTGWGALCVADSIPNDIE